MKKLLVLTLVLGIASLATAGLTISAPATVNAGETFQVIVAGTADILPASGGLDGAVYGPAKWDSAALTSNVGVGVVTDSWADFGSLDFNIGKGGAPLPETVDGAWVILTYTAGAAGEAYTYELADSDFVTIIGSASTSVVPEPATMALLGLGALVLRRRK